MKAAGTGRIEECERGKWWRHEKSAGQKRSLDDTDSILVETAAAAVN